MHAQISIGGFEQPLQVVERQGLVRGQRADDSQADTFMNQPVEVRNLRMRDGNIAMRGMAMRGMRRMGSRSAGARSAV